MTEVEIKQENLVYAKPRLITDNVMHYCPGCSHGTVHKLVAEVIDEMGLAEKAVGISPVGCSVFAYNYIDIDWIEAAHGRALAVATAVKRLHPETAELLRRVLAAHRARAKGLRAVGEREQRGESARVFLFPWFRGREDALLARLRAAVPGAFPRKERGSRGGGGLHCLRHTFATAAERAGMSDHALQTALRHKNQATTTLYLDSIRGRREPVEELERVWAEEAAREAAAAEGSSRVTSTSRGNKTGSVLKAVSRRNNRRT